jgi:integrase
MPRRRPNAELRRREHLTEAEVERLTEAAKGNRWGNRDAAMVLVAYRHGLRASELVDLHWDQVDFRTATLHVRRVKKGILARIQSSGMSYAPHGPSANRSRAGGQDECRVGRGPVQMEFLGTTVQEGQKTANTLYANIEASLALAKHAEAWEWKETESA